MDQYPLFVMIGVVLTADQISDFKNSHRVHHDRDCDELYHCLRPDSEGRIFGG